MSPHHVRLLVAPLVALILLASGASALGQGGGGPGAGMAQYCKLKNATAPGATSVLTLKVRGTGCGSGERLVGAYHRCRLAEGDQGDRCRASIAPYRCTERRSNPVGGGYEARVSCGDGGRRITHTYSWFGAEPVVVDTEAELRRAWADPLVTAIELTDDIFMRACLRGGPIRESLRPLTLDGNGHTIRQTCFEKRLLNQNGTGFLLIKDVTLTRGGNDGPGAAVTSRGEIVVMDSVVHENLSEEPGGGIFSQRKATIIRSVITGNLANDDGGGVYARRGGIQVFDSILSNNLVDGSGGALGSTGDILVVRSHVDGNTTDGDGGAIYTDEDGDVTVIDSTVDGNDADGPGGAIFTLEGDVTIVNSTVNGNRADDRGGAISGEADVTVINSTIARNAAVAHVGGGIWARSDLFVSNSTISNNYAEGQGGGVLAAGNVGLVYSTVLDNIAPVAANVGAGQELMAFGSVIGPANTEPFGGQVQPTGTNCRVISSSSSGYNLVSDGSCGLAGPGDVVGGEDPMLAELGDNGGLGETRVPLPNSPALDRIPVGDCSFAPFGYALEGEQHLGAFGIDPLAPVTTDQRGVGRAQGEGCDVGAVELGSAPPPAPASLPEPRAPEGEGAPTSEPDGQEGPIPASTTPEPMARETAPTLAPRQRGRGRSVGARGARSQVGAMERRVDFIERRIEIMERIARRYRQFGRCLTRVPVSEYGDRDHRFGFHYDERDGTGLDRRPALARDSDRRNPDYTFLKFDRRDACQSAPTRPGTPERPGTADPAKRQGGNAASVLSGIRTLERRLEDLDRREGRLEDMSEHFDEFESCLSWVPVTEYGDPDGGFGYLFGGQGGVPRYRAAITIDVSEWDDPDYMFLGFERGDLPSYRSKKRRGGDETPAPPAPGGPSGRECGGEPGESVDKAPAPGRARGSHGQSKSSRSESLNDRLVDVRQEIASFAEDVEDLGEPVEEFDTFDQCMHLIGVNEYGNRSGTVGYHYGAGKLRPAFSLDFSRGRPEYQMLAHPGEEPPSIECNEDAGGLFTNE
jgi:hypothetical protein